jgi:hypothetical protein
LEPEKSMKRKKNLAAVGARFFNVPCLLLQPSK